MKETERFPIAPNVKESLLRLGVKGVLYDLDDTLIYTSEIFKKFMNEYVDLVVDGTGVNRDVFYDELSRINDEEYLKMGVNPARWSVVTERLGKLFADKRGVIRGNLSHLMKIYKTVPRMRKGARETIDVVKEAGAKQILVTHANEDWTIWKLDQLGMLFVFDGLMIANENGHKSKKHWEEAMDMLRLSPRECLVVGDNLGGDIIPAASLGARTVWMPSPWSMYRAGEVPEETIQISEFDQFLEALDRLT